MLAYEQLQGADGRQRRFRAPRYDARRLFPNLLPRVRVRSTTYRLHDISLGGLAALAKQADQDALEPGEKVELSIQQSGIPIFETAANVCRLESTVFGSKIAFSFLDRHMDLAKLLTRNAQAQIAASASGFASVAAHPLSVEYRAFCADVVRLVRGYGAILDESARVAKEFGSGLEDADLFETCEACILQPWRTLWRTGNELVSGISLDKEMRDALKEYTESVVTPELRRGAIWDRSYAKPLGYPGDFGIMNQVYDWQRVGQSAYDMLMHRLGLDVAECIRTRMEVVMSQIGDVARDRAYPGPTRITSLGSGPAREVEGFLKTRNALDCHVVFTLIDQEAEALRYATDSTYPYTLRSNGHIAVHGLNISFTDILRSTSALAHLPPQHLIYSVGLLDYLSAHRCKALVKRLYECLAPGGFLIIGNMNECVMSNHWPMEFVVDWSLHYRNEADMLAWTDALGCRRAWTETERTGRVRVLFAEKP
jgi:extracellular factor (EF) 3-hydroxypalmitic acid methyl ester biosynthesis protein